MTSAAVTEVDFRRLAGAWVNVIWRLVFAFSEWPIHKELAMFRSRYGAATSGFPVMPPTSQPPSQYS